MIHDKILHFICCFVCVYACRIDPYLNLFEHFGYRLTVKFLTGLFIGREDLFHRHIMSCKKEERNRKVREAFSLHFCHSQGGK